MEHEKKTIFLVDDNSTILQAGKNVLEDAYNVITADSGEAMFKLLDINKPSLILLDIDMPGMNGYEVIKKLKNDPGAKEIPVIFLTGKTEVNSKLEGYSLGAVDYITKPFDAEALLSRIRLSLM